MPKKPSTAEEYSDEQLKLARATCLYVATKLGDCMQDIVIVGGLVPSLLIDQDSKSGTVDRHVGTMDLDIGLSLGIFSGNRYQAITDRLKSAGFVQDENEQGNPTRQRWKIEAAGKVTVDFLVPPSDEHDEGGKIRNIEADFAAVITPGLRLAFQDRRKIRLSGKTIFEEAAERDVWVCGPGAFVVLKALAFRDRGENKDAYDLYYHIRTFGSGIEDVADALKPYLFESEVRKALDILKDDFTGHESLGPVRVAKFLTNRRDDDIQADVAGFIRTFLELCK